MRIRVAISRLVEYFAQLYLLLRKPQRIPNSLLIIKIDNIGDYVLFRNFLETIRANPKFANSHISLIGNHVWRDLAETFDASFIDQFYWMDRKQFTNSLQYRFNFFLQFGKFDVLLNPTYSRTYEVDDQLARYIRADRKIASNADLSNITKAECEKGDRCYDELISVESGIKFEFFRYKDFFANYLKSDPGISKPRLPFTKHVSRAIIFFPGGTYQSKLWSSSNYAKLIELVVRKLGVEAIICGGKSEVAAATEIVSKVRVPVTNVVGTITLTELVRAVSRCALLVANETGVIHIANALDKPYVCIADGVNLLRFSPYPPELSTGIHIFPAEIMNSSDDIATIAPMYAQGTVLKAQRSAEINSISPDQVFAQIEIMYQNIQKSDY